MPTPTHVKRGLVSGLTMPFDPFYSRGLTPDQVQFRKDSYDLLGLIRSGTGPAANHSGLDLEYEVGGNIAANMRNAYNRHSEPIGVWTPAENWCRDAVSDTGGNLVETHVEPSIANALKPFSACQAAGARTITDLRSNFSQPVWQSTPTPSGLAENTTVTQFPGDTFVLQQMSPFRVEVGRLFTRQLLVQSSPDLQRFVRLDFLTSIASAVDRFILCGNGNNQPNGIINLSANTGTGNSVLKLAPTITFGGAPTYNSLTTAISNVTSQNVADDGTMGWIVSEATWKVFKETPIISGFPRYLIEDGRILEKPCYQTNNLSAALGGNEQVVFGRWSDCVIGFWGNAIDIFSDPYTYADAGLIYVRAGVLINYILVHANAFTISTDSGAQ